jgi:DNA-binding NtrC family response regulator
MPQSSDALPRTLVVDDEMDIAKMMAVILRMNCFDAIPYSDPSEALHAAKAEPPEYLITDLAMPGMNGIELAHAIVDAIPECKVLLFSGQVEAEETIENASKPGRKFTLVQKPIHPNDLVAVLRSL